MKERFLFVLAVAVSLLSGCVKEEFFSEGGSIAAVMEDVQTRTEVTDEGTFSWSSGDKVWLEITSNPGYVTGTLSSGAGTGSADFVYGSYFGEMTGKAVYPFNTGHDISGDELTVALPATYDLGSDLRNTNAVMYGVQSKGKIKFNHLAGVMRFKFKNAPAGIDTFVITLDKKINGTFTADLTADHPTIHTENTSKASEKSITLSFDALAQTQDIYLYVPLPLGTYTTLGLEIKSGDQSVWSYTNNVTNTINRRSLILMPAVTLSGSITGDIEGGETPEGPGAGNVSSYAIGFDTSVTQYEVYEFDNNEFQLLPMTRSESVDFESLQRPLDSQGGFQVYSFVHNYIEPEIGDDTYVDVSAISTHSAYMDTEVTWDDNGYWDYPGETNWPVYSPSRKLAFAAYALNVEDDIEWDEDPNVPANEITGHPEGQSYTKFTYTVPDRVSDQKDLLVTPFLPNQGIDAMAGVSPVQLNFKHLLSRVGFQVVSNQDSDVDIEIKEVTLHGLFPRKGRVDLKGSGVIDPITTEDDPNAEYVTSYDLFSGDNYFRTTSSTRPVDIYANRQLATDLGSGDYVELENNDHSNRYMMIMPSEQPVTGGTVVTDELPGSYIEVKYQLMDDIVQTARVSLDGWRFEGGKAYNFIFKVSTHSIEFEVSVDSWNEAYTRSESSDLESLKRPVEEYGGMKVSSFLHNYIEPTSAPWGDDIYYGDSYIDVSAVPTYSAYMDKIVNWFDDYGYWDYAGVDYWPDYSPSRKLAFAAYALNAEENIEWDDDYYVAGNEMTGHPEGQSYTKFTYTVPDRVSEQKDLLVTPFLPNQGIDENANPTPVHLNFKHLLSRVGFQVVANQDSDVEIAIKQVTLHGLFPRKGRVDLKGRGVIEPIIDADYATSYDLFSGNEYFRTTSSTRPVDIYANRQLATDLGSGGYVEFENNDHSNRYMMIMPSQQQYNDIDGDGVFEGDLINGLPGAYVEMTYQLTDADVQTAIIPLDGWRFESGKSYDFIFEVSTYSIEFETYITSFDDGIYENNEYPLNPIMRSGSVDLGNLQQPIDEYGGMKVYSFMHNYIEPTSAPWGDDIYYGDSYVDVSAVPTYSAYMDKIVNWVDDYGYWDYPGVVYWPHYSSARKLAFAAYALNAEENIEWDYDYNVAGNEMTGHPQGRSYTKFTYTVPDRVSDQKDLLVTPFLPNQGIDAMAGASPVQLNFKHLLSRVGFQVVANQDSDVEIAIKQVTLHGLFPRKGRVDLKGRGVIEPIIDADYTTSYDLFSGNEYFRTTSSTRPVDIYANRQLATNLGSGGYVEFENNDHSNRYMMIMPSEQPRVSPDGELEAGELPGAYIEVKYQLTEADEHIARVSLDGWKFESGKSYNFIFKVSTLSIQFDVCVDSWNGDYAKSESSDLESLKRPLEYYGGMKVSSFMHNYIEPTSAPWGDDIYYGDSYVDVSAVPTYSAYMDKIVNWVDDYGYWDYPGVVYWPHYSSARKLAFAAYALNAEENIEWDYDYNVAGNEMTGHPQDRSYTKFTYTVPDRVSDQKDLLVTPFLPNQGIDAMAGASPVQLNFKHLLSRVGFQVVANQDSDVEIAIKQVTLHGLFPRKGRVDLKGRGVIEPIIDADYTTSYDLFSGNEYFRTTSSTRPVDIYANRQLATDLGSGGYVEFENNDHSNRYMMIIPSQQPSGAYIEVTYQLTGADERTTVLPLDGWRFEAGKAYTFCFVVSPLSLNLEVTEGV